MLHGVLLFDLQGVYGLLNWRYVIIIDYPSQNCKYKTVLAIYQVHPYSFAEMFPYLQFALIASFQVKLVAM